MSDWRESAACKGRPARLWFPGVVDGRLRKRDDDPYAYGRVVCAGCPVRQECEDYALEVREKEGLWGGLDPAERGKLLRRQAKPRIARKEPNHGTTAGHKQHGRLGEKACDACAEAKRASNGYHASKVAV